MRIQIRGVNTTKYGFLIAVNDKPYKPELLTSARSQFHGSSDSKTEINRLCSVPEDELPRTAFRQTRVTGTSINVV